MADEQAGRGFRFPWPMRAASRGRRLDPSPVPDWRDTLRSRLVVGAVICALWTGAIEARLLYLQVIQHDEMVKLDYLYVTNWSLWWDMKLMLQTVPIVVGRRGY